ncbi:hypothetical protein GGI24_001895 [Coemansia furcata]|nr:hypothetical protein GGI24_001895 [Coemansia furcata]
MPKASSRKQPQKTPKVQTSHGAPNSAAVVPSGVLQLIYEYLSPPVHSALMLLEKLLVFQRLAGVNHQWRAVAMPQLYLSIVVDIDEPTKKLRKHSNGYKLWTNIGLFVGTDLGRMAREVRITVRGSGQTLLLLAQKLRSVGLGNIEWLGVEKLYLDTSMCTFKGLLKKDQKGGRKCLDELNELLSAALPSLQEIAFLGPGANELYNCVPIQQLINERLSGSQPLRVLRITSDIHPNFTSPLSQPSTPIQLTCLDINTIITDGNGAPLRLPPLLASTLVELRLGSVYVKRLWEPFVAPTKGDLVFSSLKSLTLCFSLGCEIQPRRTNAVKFAVDSEDEDWWEEEDDGYHGFSSLDPESETDTHGYMASKKFGVPQFPTLANLEIRRFPRNLKQFLSLFEASPITTLSLWSLKHRIPDDLDLAQFGELRDLSVRFMDTINEYDEERINNALSYMFSTVNPKLQSLTLMIHSYDQFALGLPDPPFADNLTTLTIEGHNVLAAYITILPMFTNLQRLNAFASVADSIPAADFVGERKLRMAQNSLPPLSTSLRCVRAEHLQRFAEEERWGITTDMPRNAAEEVSLYRDLILNLVCHVPSLKTLMVSHTSLEGVQKSMNILAKPRVGPEQISAIRCVAIPVVDEFYFALDY